MKKRFFTKFMFLALSLLCVGTNSVWGAGYTATLSADYKLTGYNMKAFYNFTTNTPAVLPTSGDLRYREGYGLHNYGSGGRSATVSIPVSKGDILVVQVYAASTFNYISGGTKNESLTSTTGYIVYDMTADATSETWAVYRYGGFVSAVVMEKDESAKTADYTIKYQDADGNTLKDDVTYADGVVVGAQYTASATDMASFYNDGKTKKYIYSSGNETKTAAESGNVIILVFREAATYNYTVKNNLSETILYSGTAFEGDNVTVTYPYYINVEGTLYYKAAQSNEYHEKFAVTENDYQHVLTYTATAITNVVFLAEGEDIFTAGTGSSANIRCSMEEGGYTTEKTTFDNLSAGKYVLVCSNRCKAELKAVHTFYAGDAIILEADGNGYNAVRTSEEFIIATPTDIAMNGGSKDNLVDWVYIQRTGDVAVVPLNASGTFSTYCNATYALDFTDNADVAAYKASAPTDSKVTLTQVYQVPAGAGVVLKKLGSNASATVNVIASAEALTDNKMVGVTTAITATDLIALEGDEYILSGDKFCKVVEGASGSLAAGKAYLSVPASAAKTLDIEFDETTGIEETSLSPALSTSEGAYNLNGVRVNENYKGIVIVNGKKYLNK